MTRRELIAYFGFKVEDAPLKNLEKQIGGIRQSLEFLAAAEILKGVVELTEKFTHFAEELHVAAQSAGITVEEFQRLAFAAGQSAVSQEEMSGSLARLSRHLYDARKGGEESQKAFADIGISPEQLTSFRSGSEAMLALADRFKAIDDPIRKQALAMQLFGRGSLNMVGFLSQGSAAIKGMGGEAEKLGIILSEKQVGALVQLEHSLQKVWAVFKAIGATIATYVAPIFESAIKNFLTFYEANRKILDVNFKAWAEDLAYVLGYIHGLMQSVVEVFLKFASTHQVLIRRIFEFALALGVLAGTIFVVQKLVGILTGAFELLKVILGPLEFIWTRAMMPAILFIGGIARALAANLFLKLATLTETLLPALSEAFLGLGAAIEATPVGWIATAVAALVVVLHDAWTLLSGGKWEDTWVAKAFHAVKGFGGKALDFLGLGSGNPDNQATNKNPLQSGLEGLQKPLEGASNAVTNLGQIGNLSTPSFGPSLATPAPGNYSVNAPITINIPHASDPKVMGEKVKEGVQEHLDSVYRRTQQSLRSNQAY